VLSNVWRTPREQVLHHHSSHTQREWRLQLGLEAGAVGTRVTQHWRLHAGVDRVDCVKHWRWRSHVQHRPTQSHINRLTYVHPCMHVITLVPSRLSNTNLLSAPFVCTSFGSRSFSIAAAKIWNSLPLSLLYQSWYLSSSLRDPLLPAGLPNHWTALLLSLRFSFAFVSPTPGHLCTFINYIYLLTYITQLTTTQPCTVQTSASCRKKTAITYDITSHCNSLICQNRRLDWLS